MRCQRNSRTKTSRSSASARSALCCSKVTGSTGGIGGLDEIKRFPAFPVLFPVCSHSCPMDSLSSQCPACSGMTPMDVMPSSLPYLQQQGTLGTLGTELKLHDLGLVPHVEQDWEHWERVDQTRPNCGASLAALVQPTKSTCERGRWKRHPVAAGLIQTFCYNCFFR